jgi:DmsE family decaheme c-type cytochrome
MNQNRMLRIAVILLALGLFAGLAAAQGEPENCTDCHDTVGPAVLKTPHAKANNVKCSDCHGVHQGDEPSADNINSFRKPVAQDVVKTCTKCHTTIHANESTHAKTDRGCLNCHDMWHSEATTKARPIPADKLLKKTSVELCLPCHRKVGGEINKPYHHQQSRIAILCVNCHNPHKTDREIRSGDIDRKCAECHPETGGPFMYVHLGAQYRGCVECHAPHGSPYPNLLTRSTVRFLCLSCHPDTPSFHDQANPRFANCTSCHPAIHGSNVDHLFMN